MRVLIFTIALSISCFSSAFSQRVHELKLGKSEQSIDQFSYYIESVEDIREDTSSIGKIYKGPSKAEYLVQLKDGVVEEVYDYLKYYVPESNNARPLTVKIVEFKVAEVDTDQGCKATFELRVKLFEKGSLLSTEHLIMYKNAKNCRSYHVSNIEAGLRNLIIQFAAGYHSGTLHKYENNEEINVNYGGQLDETNGDRNVIAIGYQIGGWTLIGIDYEFRLNNVFGIHFGGGWIGYSAGVKLHFDKYKNSGFLNLSYKDGGVGLIRTVNIEVGGHIPLSQSSDFGIHAQVGAGIVLGIDPMFSRAVFDSNETPNIVFSFGLGVSF